MQRALKGIRRTTLALVVLAGLLMPAAAAAQARTETPFGIAFTPAQVPVSTDEQVLQGLIEAAAVGGHVTYMWEWASGDEGLTRLQGLMPFFRALGLKVLVQVNPTGIGEPAPPSPLPKTFTDSAVRAAFLSGAETIALLQPDYLVLGAEINLVHYLNKPEFDAYETLYREAYAIVKTLAPNTKVGVSYHMDLFFGDETEFELVDTLGPQDFIGFTTYPAWTVYKGFYPSVTEIAPEYYSRIRSVIPDRPIVFTEVGWPSAGRGSLEDQAAFVAHLPELLKTVKPELVSWAMQHDVRHFNVDFLNSTQREILENFDVIPEQLFDELNTMGILSWDGPPKPAWMAALGLVFEQ